MGATLIFLNFLYIILLLEAPVRLNAETTAVSNKAPISIIPHSDTLKYCEEVFQLGEFTFPKTVAGATALPNLMCFESERNITSRKCLENGTWDEIQNPNHEPVGDKNQIRSELCDLLLEASNGDFEEDILEQFISYTSLKLEPLDIYLMAQYAIADYYISSQELHDFAVFVNNTMSIKRSVLRDSQVILNSTDTILYVLDRTLLTNYKADIPLEKLLLKNFTGEKNDFVYSANHTDNQKHINYTAQIKISVDQNEILWLQVFKEDSLFNQENSTLESVNMIFRFLKNYQSVTPTSITIVYYNLTRDNVYYCMYWKFGIQDYVATKGRWVFESTPKYLGNGAYECKFNHEGHFGLFKNKTTYFCEEDDFIYRDFTLTFNETLGGTWAIPANEFCGCPRDPLRRRCLLNGTWGELNGCCDNRQDTSEITQLLYNRNLSLEQVLNITNTERLEAIDIYLISEIVEISYEKSEILGVIDEIYKSVNRRVLGDSQKTLNATDALLNAIDRHLTSRGEINANLSAILLQNFETDSGILLKHNRSIQTLSESDFQIKLKLENASERENIKFAVFYDDFLFNAANKTLKVASPILSFTLVKSKREKIEIYFNVSTNISSPHCGFWKYGISADGVPLEGQWISERHATLILNTNSVFKCEFNHTTHFALLLGSSPQSYNKIGTAILNVITIFGAILSLFGVAMIVLTAFIIKNWKDNENNRLVLNVALTLSFVIIFMFVSEQAKRGVICICIGVLLHFFIISNFLWTLALCYVRYYRSFIAINTATNSTKLKFAIIIWISPLFVIIPVLILDKDSYNKNTHSSSTLCYPKDTYFQFFVLLPITLILTINVYIYTKILILLKSVRSEATKSVYINFVSLRSVLCLFCVMGLTWILGILGIILPDFISSALFSCVFSIVMAFQGFILFLYYIYDCKQISVEWRMRFVPELTKFLRERRAPALIIDETKLSSEAES